MGTEIIGIFVFLMSIIFTFIARFFSKNRINIAFISGSMMLSFGLIMEFIFTGKIETFSFLFVFYIIIVSLSMSFIITFLK